MKKSEFSRELESRLSDMKPDEIESSINACIKSIDMIMFTGISEDEAVAVLGNIDELASKIRKGKGYPDVQNYSDIHYNTYNGSSYQRSDFEQEQYYRQQNHYQQQFTERAQDNKKGVLIVLIIMVFLMPFWTPFALILFLIWLLMFLIPVGAFFGSIFTDIVAVMNIAAGSVGYGLFILGIGIMLTGVSILAFLAAIKITGLLWKLLCRIFSKLTQNRSERRTAP